MTEDVVERWNRLTKAQLWAMEPGEVYNWMDEAVEEIARLRREVDHVYSLWQEASAEWDRLADQAAQVGERLEREIRPLINKDRYEGGYDCCGCTTYDEILDHAIRIVTDHG